MDSMMDCHFEDEYDHLLAGLVYSPTNIPGRGASLLDYDNQLLGCQCSDIDLCLLSNSCRSVHVCQMNYTSDKTLVEEKWGSAAIVECNSQCTCSMMCSNRVVQFGPRKDLEIFMSGPAKGYGLKTNKFIPKGAFICEYAGELIGMDEARRRFKATSDEETMNYIFVLREMVGSLESTSVIETVIDPSFIGNIGRYINHSCDPNSGIVPVRIDSSVPRLGIFAKKGILPGEEITYDYSGGQVSSLSVSVNNYVRKPCHCGTQICQGLLPIDSSLL